jgi:hypothetical protein
MKGLSITIDLEEIMALEVELSKMCLNLSHFTVEEYQPKLTLQSTSAPNLAIGGT